VVLSRYEVTGYSEESTGTAVPDAAMLEWLNDRALRESNKRGKKRQTSRCELVQDVEDPVHGTVR
jgi:hypothetical protein